MAKFSGMVGYIFDEEIRPGVYKPRKEERHSFGDVLENIRHWEPGEGSNSDMNLGNRISILADDYAYKHCSAIRYVRWMNADWSVAKMDVQRPRIILTLGGVYNGNKVKAS